MEVGDQTQDSERQERAPVQHLLILGHPDPSSFNHAVAARYAEAAQSNYQAVEIRDLYAMGFDPLLKDIERPQRRPGVGGPDVRHEVDLVERSDVITFVYPLWFGTPPAIIKGYIDRIFSAAFLLSDLKRERKLGSFVGKSLCLFTSSASTGQWLDEQGIMTSLQQSFVNLRRGRPGQLPPPVEDISAVCTHRRSWPSSPAPSSMPRWEIAKQ